MVGQTVGRRTGRERWCWLTAPFSLRGLSGFALWGFFLLSVLATGLGFADLRAAGTETGELSVAELGLTIATTLFVVSAMVVALHNMLEPGRVWWIRIAAFFFYLLFAVWTVGFGYGFFWKELAGQEFTRKQFVASTGEMAGAVERVAGAVSAAEIATREAADTASARAQQEAAEGRTCANRPASTSGEGPLMRSRFAFADRARSLSAELRQNWIDPIAGPGATLRLQADALSRGVIPTTAKAQAADEQALLGKLARAPQLLPLSVAPCLPACTRMRARSPPRPTTCAPCTPRHSPSVLRNSPQRSVLIPHVPARPIPRAPAILAIAGMWC